MRIEICIYFQEQLAQNLFVLAMFFFDIFTFLHFFMIFIFRSSIIGPDSALNYIILMKIEILIF